MFLFYFPRKSDFEPHITKFIIEFPDSMPNVRIKMDTSLRTNKQLDVNSCDSNRSLLSKKGSEVVSLQNSKGYEIKKLKINFHIGLCGQCF